MHVLNRLVPCQFWCSLRVHPAAPPVQGLMNPVSSGEPAHYIGTLPALGQDGQDPNPFLKKDVERFLWNFLAARTAMGTTSPRGEVPDTVHRLSPLAWWTHNAFACACAHVQSM